MNALRFHKAQTARESPHRSLCHAWPNWMSETAEAKAERWRRIEALFHEALERAEGERSAFLEGACDGDAGLRLEVESLLAAESAEDRIERAVAGGIVLAAEEDAEASTEAIPQRIGPYRLLEEIGRGGLGTVYLAERDEPFRMQAALKLVRRGLDTEEIMARLRQERQILARLDHPNIARLLDGGSTEDGRPYFVMERVQGEPIDLWCARRGTALLERIDLFVTACGAVQYAHQSLVVHRDLKPSNLLVTEDGVPKLLDFGIAKLLDPEDLALAALATRAEMRLLTPAYASPEQIQGLPLTTATDVYSLGVLLYQLLTGCHPYPLTGRTAAALEREILASEPLPPSEAVGRDGAEARRLRRRLQGDLDTIVLTALRKEPRERYASVEQLADDLRRHLAGLPVRARRSTLAYRAGRFARRHRTAISAAALAAAGLIAGTAAALWQASQAGQARARAEGLLAESEVQRTKAERISAFLVDLFEISEPERARGATMTAREILDRGAEGIRNDLAREPEAQAVLLLTVGQVYQKLGLYAEAEPPLRQALDLRKRVLGGGHADTAASHSGLGLLLIDRGAYEEAEGHLRQALAIRRRGGAGAEMGKCLNDLGLVLYYQGRIEEAGAFLRFALAVRQRSLGPSHPDVGETLNNQAAIRLQLRDWKAGEEALRQALAIHRVAYGNDHPEVAITLSNLGVALERQGSLEEAETVLREALAIRQKLLGRAHPEVAETLSNLSQVQRRRGDLAAARASLKEAVALDREALGRDHPTVAVLLGNLGEVELAAGDFDRAEAAFREMLRIRGLGVPAGGQGTAGTAFPLGKLGLVALSRGDPRSAEPLLREALAIRQREWDPGSWQVAESESLLGGCLAAQGRTREARVLLERSTGALRESLGESSELTRRAEAFLRKLP